jgi:hypothetical protein
LAAIKGKRSSKKSARQFIYFREVKGKIVENVEIDPDLNAITILFQDKTALSFDLEPDLPYSRSCRTGKRETGGESNDGERFTAKYQWCRGHKSALAIQNREG